MRRMVAQQCSIGSRWVNESEGGPGAAVWTRKIGETGSRGETIARENRDLGKTPEQPAMCTTSITKGSFLIF